MVTDPDGLCGSCCEYYILRYFLGETLIYLKVYVCEIHDNNIKYREAIRERKPPPGQIIALW